MDSLILAVSLSLSILQISPNLDLNGFWGTSLCVNITQFSIIWIKRWVLLRLFTNYFLKEKKKECRGST